MATVFADRHDPETPTMEGATGSGSVSVGGKVAVPDAETATAEPKKPNPAVAKGAALAKGLIAPVLGVLAFLALWGVLAPQVDTSLGALPGPVEVAEQGVALYDEWVAGKEAEAQFYADQNARNTAAIAAGNPAGVRDFTYAGAPTFLDQIFTSLKTVALGFILATLVAVPIGLAAGLSPLFNAAINPLIQIMKPVSPLAWLPIVTMVISAMITNADPLLPKAFVISALVVMLCSLWPTLINTAVGTASIDKDLLAVGRVLKLGTFAKLTKLVLPASLPYIFTGMRLSLGVGWMVLIAAEMLAQNPGLGKFVWDEFQNGSSQSLARIMFAVVVIGFIGFGLDRIMMALQALVSKNRTI
ncbi:ABC transporter permease [Croceicoccus naphthovorans]|uniref:Nitrate ABC transporter permease n=1 Tax=Croceicoccus naphthovorans TaxID=1348774 RepID=A0A0G3XET2_9SPHN|nr:ABC transporter permease [Croceicoccus naphthovorans]AKM08903.1 nitrate ABC transporter permease [Croceicoccus naphthovorans]MBB3989325.1 nitrate/nitrite transport system permease protein [Croceicoccus naphthovorans]